MEEGRKEEVHSILSTCEMTTIWVYDNEECLSPSPSPPDVCPFLLSPPFFSSLTLASSHPSILSLILLTQSLNTTYFISIRPLISTHCQYSLPFTISFPSPLSSFSIHSIVSLLSLYMLILILNQLPFLSSLYLSNMQIGSEGSGSLERSQPLNWYGDHFTHWITISEVSKGKIDTLIIDKHFEIILLTHWKSSRRTSDR